MVFHKRLRRRAKRNLGAIADKASNARERIERNKAGQLFTSVGDLGAGFVSQTARDRNRARLDRASRRGTTGRVAAGVAEASGLFSRNQKEAVVNAALFAVGPVAKGAGVGGRLAAKYGDDLFRAGRGLGGKGDDIIRVSDDVIPPKLTKPKPKPKSASTKADDALDLGKKADDVPPPKAPKNGKVRDFLSSPKKVAVAGTVTGLAAGATLAYLAGGSEGGGGSSDDGVGTDGGNNDDGGNNNGGGGGGGGIHPSPSFVTDPFLGNITAGIGSMFDRLGLAVQDLANALGIPIGEGAGKAIAIGGTAVLVAIAISKAAPALRKNSPKPKAKPKAKGKSSPKPKAKPKARYKPKVDPKTGRFLPKGASA